MVWKERKSGSVAVYWKLEGQFPELTIKYGGYQQEMSILQIAFERRVFSDVRVLVNESLPVSWRRGGAYWFKVTPNSRLAASWWCRGIWIHPGIQVGASGDWNGHSKLISSVRPSAPCVSGGSRACRDNGISRGRQRRNRSCLRIRWQSPRSWGWECDGGGELTCSRSASVPGR